MKSSPLEESRRTALEAAEQLLQINGWKALTAARIAEACGMSRQWLHALFGGQQQLVDALVDSVFGQWRSNQLDIMAARLSLADSIARSFNLLLDSSPTAAIVLRQMFVDRGEAHEPVWSEINSWWSPVWQSERSATPEEDSAVTAMLISGSLALEPMVRGQQISITTANPILINGIKGALKPR